MASQKLTVTVHPATEEDTLAMAHIESVAFDDPNSNPDEPTSLGQVMFGPPSTKAQEARAKELVNRMRTIPEMHAYKAIAHENADSPNGDDHSGGKIVALAIWRFYTEPTPTEDTWEDQKWELARNPAACNEFFGNIARTRTKWMGGKRFAWLDILCVHPDYQGKGIGKVMLRQGLADAAKLGLDEAYLEASPAGHPLYKRFGWEDLEVLEVDLSKYGGKGVWPTICMKRPKLGPLEIL